MKLNALFFVMTSLVVTTFSTSSTELWSMSQTQHSPLKANLEANYFMLDSSFFSTMSNENTKLTVSVPTPNGKEIEFTLRENNLLPDSIKTKYPHLRAFDGLSNDGQRLEGKFNFSKNQFHAMFQFEGNWVFIDPVKGEDSLYQVYFKPTSAKRIKDSVKFGLYAYAERQQPASIGTDVSPTVRRNFRLAMSAAGEYTAYHGGKANAVAAIAVAINRVNQVYNRDLAVTFNLVDNFDQLVFEDAETDPFNNDSGDGELNIDVTDNALGSTAYDIGHIFNTGGGGLAALGAVCTSFKADGVTGSDQPESDAFYVDYVAHELGHQMGSDHSFNGSTEACDGNRAENWAYEPGSGVTIMSYAGICGNENLENNGDNSSVYDYFHISSLTQIRTRLATANCAQTETTTNNAPVVNAGADFTLPANTPFELSGSATDADNDVLSYSWEQHDLGAQTSSPTEIATDDGNRPIIRNYPLTSSGNRIVPKLDDLLAGTTTLGEILPTTSRRLTFRLVVRDGNGAISDDETKLTVVDTGSAFRITSPNSGTFSGEASQTIFWDVANTNQAPINCASVDILLSQNGGNNFDTTLLANTENDGEANITWPNIESSTARLKIACSDNIFFDVNDSNLTLSPAAVTVPVISGQTSLTLNEDGSLAITRSNFTFSAGNTDDLTITVNSGTNYTVANNTISPSADFFGVLSVPVTATNSAGTSAPFAAEVTVSPVNDAPVINSTQSGLSINNNESLTITLDLVDYTDVDNETVTLSVLTGANYTFNGNTVTPVADFVGTMNVAISISDGELSATGNIPISVIDPSSGAVAPVISGQQTLTLNEDSSLVLSVNNLTLSAGNSGTLTLNVNEGDNYTVSGTQITPEANFNGNLTVPVTVTNTVGTSAPFNLTIVVTPVNDAPTIDSVASGLSITNDQSITLSLDDIGFTDVDSDVITLSVLTGNNYSVSNNQVTPNTGFVGTLSVNIEISDGALTDSATISISVTQASTGNPTGDSSGSGGGGSMQLLMLLFMSLMLAARYFRQSTGAISHE